MRGDDYISSRNKHDTGVLLVAQALSDVGMTRNDFIGYREDRLEPNQYAIAKQTKYRPEQGLIPYDILANFEGLAVRIKVHAISGPQCTSLWRCVSYAVEATGKFSTDSAYVQIVTSQDISGVGLGHKFPKALEILAASYEETGAISIVCTLHEFLAGKMQDLIDQRKFIS